MAEQQAASSGAEDDVEGTWFVPSHHNRSFRGTLRRNSSLPSFSAAEDAGGLIPRNKSYDNVFDSDDDECSEAHLMEVDGKAVLAPQSERLALKSNPYVGTFHYGHEASKKLSGQTESQSGASHLSPRKNSPGSNPITDTSVAASPMLSPHKSPPSSSSEGTPTDHPMPFLNGGEAPGSVSPMGSPMALSPMRTAILPRSLSRSNSNDSSHSGQGKPITATDRQKMKEGVHPTPYTLHPHYSHSLTHSFTHSLCLSLSTALQLDASVPADPEMCGLQALLPRQSGIQVQYTIGEGSFGKCVKVVNRKNRQEWSKSTSKRGIERHLNDMPLEGDSLVVKYILKEDPAQNAMLFEGIDDELLQSAVQREIRIHAKCNHPNIVRLFGVRPPWLLPRSTVRYATVLPLEYFG